MRKTMSTIGAVALCLVGCITLSAGAEKDRSLAVPSALAESAPPAITSFSYMTHLGSMIISVVGENLGDATRVIIGHRVATFSVVDGQILAMVKGDAVSGPITVITPKGKAVSEDWVDDSKLPEWCMFIP
jgi:hypothetical protein